MLSYMDIKSTELLYSHTLSSNMQHNLNILTDSMFSKTKCEKISIFLIVHRYSILPQEPKTTEPRKHPKKSSMIFFPSKCPKLQNGFLPNQFGVKTRLGCIIKADLVRYLICYIVFKKVEHVPKNSPYEAFQCLALSIFTP